MAVNAGHWIRRAVGLAGLLLVAISPFIVFGAVRLTRPDPEPPWPSNVSLAVSADGVLREIAVLRVGKGPVLVRVPTAAKLQVPGAGELRAVTAFSIGGMSLLAQSLEETIGVDVPYWVHGEVSSVLDLLDDGSRHNLGTRAREVALLLARTRTEEVPVVGAPGRSVLEDGIRVYAIDVIRTGAVLSGRRTPAPPVSLEHGDIEVEVARAGGTRESVARVAARLEKDGFDVGRTTRVLSGRRKTTIYFSRDRRQGLEVEGVIGGVAGPSALPSGLRSDAHVLVVLGTDGIPEIRPSTISVQVSRAGGSSADADRVAASLRREGFRVITGSALTGEVRGVNVYWRRDKRHGFEVAEVLEEVRGPARVPSRYRTTAHVLVVVGR